MRQIVLDTETTGLRPEAGDRIVEIGCVELVNGVPTGRIYRVYLNPERAMPADAEAVHGLSTAFLADKPRFAAVVDEFLAFIADAPLVIHNARFDLGFLNAELARLGRPALADSRAIDTVQLAREKYFGAPASLDALCRRFDIDLSERALHGALKDCHLLAEVYLHLIGGRQPGFDLAVASTRDGVTATPVKRTPLIVPPSAGELAAHAGFLDKLPDPLWRKLASAGEAETSEPTQ